MATSTDTKAQELSRAFEWRERDNGDKYVCLKDGSPEWMTDVCHKAHGDMFPDDWRYRLIERCADALAESEDEDDARSSLEADIYTGQLTDWLGSRADRFSYCDEYMKEFGGDFPGMIELIQRGQWMEMEEVFYLVVEALAALSEDEDADES